MLKNLKRIISVVLAVILLVSAFTICINAAVEDDYSEDLSKYGEYISNDELGETVAYGDYIQKSEYQKLINKRNALGASYNPSFTPITDTSGNVIKYVSGVDGIHSPGITMSMIKINGSRAYCIQPGVHTNTGVGYTMNGTGAWDNLTRNQKQAVNTALCYGREGNFNNISSGTSIKDGQAYIATQVIIWEIVRGVRNSVSPFTLKQGQSGYIGLFCANGANPNIKTAYTRILQAMMTYQKRPSFTGDSEANAPIITLNSTYNALQNKWTYGSVTLDDANKVLSSNFSAWNGKTLNTGNATVKFTVANNKLTLTVTSANIYKTGVVASAYQQKTGIPQSTGGIMVPYAASGYQDLVAGGKIDPPMAYFKVRVDLDQTGKINRDFRIRKSVATQKEYDLSDDDYIDGALSTSDNLEGWYFNVIFPDSMAQKYGVTSIVIGPTDKTGFTESLSSYIIKNLNYSNVSSLVDEGYYYISEAGRVNVSENAISANYTPMYKLNGNTSQSYLISVGSRDLNDVVVITNIFEIPLQITKSVDDGSTTSNYFFEVTRKSDGFVYLIKTTENGSRCANEREIASKVNRRIGTTNYLSLPEGEYTLKELGVSDGNGGYKIPDRFETPSEIDFEVSAEALKAAQENGDSMIKIEVANKCSGYFNVHKTDSENPDKSLEGAVYGVFSDEDCMELIYQFPPTDEYGNAVSDVRFACGSTYYIKEIVAPPAYQLSKDVFSVSLTPQNVERISLTQEVDNPPTVTKIRKTDITGGTEIEGAHLSVKEADNLSNVADEWVSTTEPHIIKGLIKGKSYVLTESIPAPGYVTANSITFTVNEDGSTTEVTMKDDITRIAVEKLDENNQPISGIKLQILEGKTGDNVVVPTWTTDGTPYRIDGLLTVGKTYRLHEVSTLPEYTLAEDVEFTVNDTAEVQTVTMINHFATGSVTLHKRDGDGNSLAGSEWKLFTEEGEAVSASAESPGRFIYDENSTSVTFSTDDNGDLFVDKLPFGSYYFLEVKAPKNSMAYAKKIPFTISGENASTKDIELTVKDNKVVIYETGSSGTAPFAVAGMGSFIILMVGVAAYITKKRKIKEESLNEKNNH